MGIKCGIVGLPNVGKSTFFNAVCQSSRAQAANYPFCTIEPNKAFVNVPDERLSVLAKIAESQKLVPAVIEFIDIAGLVKGASQGEGCGNKFLSHIMEVDLIVHVVRCFTDDNIVHVDGRVDPISDIGTIETELMLYDLDKLERKQSLLSKKAKAGNKELKLELELIEDLIKHLSKGCLVNTYPNLKANYKQIKSFFLLTSKPMIYVCNVNEEDILAGNGYTELVVNKAKSVGCEAINICAKLEDELNVFDNISDKQEALRQSGISTSGIDKVICAAYSLLNLHSYFTVGETEARMWTIPKAATAREAAGVIHTDFYDGFIKAEVISYEDYKKYGEKAGQEGLMRIEGKDYIVQDADVMHFLFHKTK